MPRWWKQFWCRHTAVTRHIMLSNNGGAMVQSWGECMDCGATPVPYRETLTPAITMALLERASELKPYTQEQLM